MDDLKIQFIEIEYLVDPGEFGKANGTILGRNR
jgi:hypothetical protein